MAKANGSDLPAWSFRPTHDEEDGHILYVANGMALWQMLGHVPVARAEINVVFDKETAGFRSGLLRIETSRRVGSMSHWLTAARIGDIAPSKGVIHRATRLID